MDLQVVIRGMWRRRRRSALTVGAVAVGAALYMILVASAEGFLEQFKGLVAVFDSQIVVQQESATSPWSSLLTPQQVVAVSRVAGVDSISRVSLGKTRLEQSPYFLVFGLDPGEYVVSRLPVTDGKRLAADPGEAMLGARAAERLRLGVNQHIDVRRQRFRIVGVFRTGNAILDSSAVLALETVQELFNLRENVHLLFLLVEDERDRARILARQREVLPGMEAATESSWVDVYGQMNVVEDFARSLAMIAMLIAAMSVANAIQVNVSEQARELAILRALGWSRWRVARLVLLDGLFLAGLGGLLAVPLAVATLKLVAVAHPGHFYSSGMLPFTLGLAPAIEGWMVALLAGAVGAAVPLARVLRMETARVLREY